MNMKAQCTFPFRKGDQEKLGLKVRKTPSSSGMDAAATQNTHLSALMQWIPVTTTCLIPSSTSLTKLMLPVKTLLHWPEWLCPLSEGAHWGLHA